MKILVTAKRVTDYDSKVVPTADGTGIDYDNVDFKMNPFCEIAVEAAVQISEEVDDCEIIVVAMGDEDATKELRGALAMGAHRAILVECEEAELDSDSVAKMLTKISLNILMDSAPCLPGRNPFWVGKSHSDMDSIIVYL